MAPDNGGYARAQASDNPRGITLKYSDDDVDDEYQLPTDFDLAKATAEVTTGPGFTVLKNVYSQKDIEMMKERVLQRLSVDTTDYTAGDEDRDFGHNNFSGMDADLFHVGKIFSKMVTHPSILALSKSLLGNRCRLSGFCSNTVPPGCGGQKPHLDYPYYREMWPEGKVADTNFAMDPNHLLSMVFVTAVSDFTLETGATAFVPYSQLTGKFPDNEEEFMKNAQRLICKAGDVGVISGRLQHCAMPNISASTFRCGIIQQMTPLYVNSFQDMTIQARDWHSDQVKEMIVIKPPKW